MPGRPSKQWFNRCTAGVQSSGTAYDPGAVCGAQWKKKTAAEKAAIVRAEERSGRFLTAEGLPARDAYDHALERAAHAKVHGHEALAERWSKHARDVLEQAAKRGEYWAKALVHRMKRMVSNYAPASGADRSGFCGSGCMCERCRRLSGASRSARVGNYTDSVQASVARITAATVHTDSRGRKRVHVTWLTPSGRELASDGPITSPHVQELLIRAKRDNVRIAYH